jgi:hypothetical protein
MTPCTHEGFHSGQGRYDQETQQLRYVVVCDSCRSEVREVVSERYAPAYDPHGNDGYLTS